MAPHGTIYKYKRLGCRCDECRAANNAYQKQSGRARNARLASLPASQHGSHSTYNNYRCRCDLCSAAQSVYNARNYARRHRQAVA